MNDLCQKPAYEVHNLLARGDVSPGELVEASIARIEAVDEAVNALPIHCFSSARTKAQAFDMAAARQNPRSLLGLPIAVKDYNDLGGATTTYGSPIFTRNVAKVSDATVARLQANGAIAVAKSNVPEWAGGNTFNPVFGPTRNPWDLRMSAGGSSGGSAAALASGSVWLATGNDLGGSLRTPSAFNGIVGLRPGPGRVPRGRRLPAFDMLWVEGPMGRCVRDAALMLDAESGYDPGDPLTFNDETSFVECLEREARPARIAFSPDLGIVPMEPEIAEICRKGAAQFISLGAEITDDIPDFSGALDAFQALRAVLFATLMQATLSEHRNRIAPEIIGNIERGLNIDPQQIFDAERVRHNLYHGMAKFFETHDFLVCPAASVAPFPVEQRYVETINGRKCESYIDWFSITFALTLTACPVLSLPCGFTRNGLPVGMQIVGRPRGEAALLNAAYHLEPLLGIANQVPVVPRTGHD